MYVKHKMDVSQPILRLARCDYLVRSYARHHTDLECILPDKQIKEGDVLRSPGSCGDRPKALSNYYSSMPPASENESFQPNYDSDEITISEFKLENEEIDRLTANPNPNNWLHSLEGKNLEEHSANNKISISEFKIKKEEIDLNRFPDMMEIEAPLTDNVSLSTSNLTDPTKMETDSDVMSYANCLKMRFFTQQSAATTACEATNEETEDISLGFEEWQRESYSLSTAGEGSEASKNDPASPKPVGSNFLIGVLSRLTHLELVIDKQDKCISALKSKIKMIEKNASNSRPVHCKCRCKVTSEQVRSHELTTNWQNSDKSQHFSSDSSTANIYSTVVPITKKTGPSLGQPTINRESVVCNAAPLEIPTTNLKPTQLPNPSATISPIEIRCLLAKITTPIDKLLLKGGSPTKKRASVVKPVSSRSATTIAASETPFKVSTPLPDSISLAESTTLSNTEALGHEASEIESAPNGSSVPQPLTISDKSNTKQLPVQEECVFVNSPAPATQNIGTASLTLHQKELKRLKVLLYKKKILKM